MAKLRLVQLLVGEPHGGAERFYEKLSIALHEEGVPQTCVIKRDAERAAILRDGGCDVLELDFGKGPRDWLARRALARHVRGFEPTAVMAWMSRAARRMPRGEFVKLARIGGYYPPRFYRRCDWVIAIAPDLREWFVGQGWPDERCRLISNFGEIRNSDPITRASLDTPEDAKVILALSRLHESKGIDLLLRALADLPEAVAWIGGAGPEEAALKALSVELGVEPRVRWLGWRPDSDALLREADICCLPSRHEPLSNTVVESLCYGTPLVAAACAGPSFIVEDGRSGLLVPIDDAEALGTALARVIREPGLAEQLGEGGQARWRAAFSRQAIVGQYLDFFEEIGAGTR